MEHDRIINFLKEVETFKTCERDCKTSCPERAESDAEHSWHLALFLMLLEDHLESIDMAKLLKLAIVHDLPEIYAGDTNPYRGDTAGKEIREKEAAQRLFALLPEDLNQRFTAIFQEYVDQETIESQIVKAADKLMPLVQNICTNETYSSYRNLNVDIQEVKAYMDKYFPSQSILRPFYKTLLTDAEAEEVFYMPENNATMENASLATGVDK